MNKRTVVYAVLAAIVPAIVILSVKPIHDFYEWYGYSGFESFSATLFTIALGLYAAVIVVGVRGKWL